MDGQGEPIRRYRDTLGRLVPALPALALVAIAILWPLSLACNAGVGFSPSQRQRLLFFIRDGEVRDLVLGTAWLPVGVGIGNGGLSVAYFSTSPSTGRDERAVPGISLGRFAWTGDAAGLVQVTAYTLHTSFWLIAVPPAAICLAQYITRIRRTRRPALGRCPACGYDCRATPDRCPECGVAQTAALAPAIDESRMTR